MNEKEFDFLGITRWHEEGYTGKGITICSIEDVIKGVFDDVICDDPFTTKSDKAKHGTYVMDYIRQVAPDSIKIAKAIAGGITNGAFSSEQMNELLDNPPNILTSSTYSSSDKQECYRAKFKELKDKGCYLVSGAGNNGKDGMLVKTEDDLFKAIGSCRYNNGVLTKVDSSSEGEELDYMCLDNLYAICDEKKHKGTSFSNPLFGGMLCLVQQFFLDNFGELLSNEMLDKFVLDNCVDLEIVGFDTVTGNGLFRLPEPTTINPYRYIKKYKTYENWKEAIEYLYKQGEMDSPTLWLNRIHKNYDIDLMWFVTKWANAVASKNITNN